jgi:hypothetical protein
MQKKFAFRNFASFAVIDSLLSCAAKKEAKKAARCLAALRVPSPAWENGRDFAASPRFPACLGSQPIGGQSVSGKLSLCLCASVVNVQRMNHIQFWANIAQTQGRK